MTTIYCDKHKEGHNKDLDELVHIHVFSIFLLHF